MARCIPAQWPCSASVVQTPSITDTSELHACTTPHHTTTLQKNKKNRDACHVESGQMMRRFTFGGREWQQRRADKTPSHRQDAWLREPARNAAVTCLPRWTDVA